jgi:hemerythrin-like metal-binding protein
MSSNRRTSQWIYELLPYLYIGGGGTALLWNHQWLGIASASLLTATGVFVIYKRTAHRRITQKLWDDHHHLGTTAGNNKKPVSRILDPLEWHPSYYFANPLIDKGHKALFSMSNELIDAFNAHKSDKAILQILDSLMEDVLLHLAKEEGVMTTMQYAQLEQHKDIHRSLFTKATEYRSSFDSGKVSLEALVDFVTKKLVAGHLISDLKLRTPW